MKQAAGAGAPSIAPLHLAAGPLSDGPAVNRVGVWLMMPNGPRTVLLSICPQFPHSGAV